MNLRRSLSRHQAYYLREIASGRIVLFWSTKHHCAVSQDGYLLGLASKSRGSRLQRCGNHFHSSVVELMQRGVLIRDGDRIVPSKEAGKQYGNPPSIKQPKRTFRMSRTRAARVQAGE